MSLLSRIGPRIEPSEAPPATTKKARRRPRSRERHQNPSSSAQEPQIIYLDSGPLKAKEKNVGSAASMWATAEDVPPLPKKSPNQPVVSLPSQPKPVAQSSSIHAQPVAPSSRPASSASIHSQPIPTSTHAPAPASSTPASVQAPPTSTHAAVIQSPPAQTPIDQVTSPSEQSTARSSKSPQPREREIDSAAQLLQQLNIRKRQAASATLRRVPLSAPVALPNPAPVVVESEKELQEAKGKAKEDGKDEIEQRGRLDRKEGKRIPSEPKAMRHTVQVRKASAEQSVIQQSSQETAQDIAPAQIESENTTPILPTPKKHRNWADDSEDEDDDLGIEEWGITPDQLMNRKVSPTTSRKSSAPMREFIPPRQEPQREYVPAQQDSRWATPRSGGRRKEQTQQSARRLARLGMPVR